MMEHNPEGAISVLENLLAQEYAPVKTLVALSDAYYQNQQAARSLQTAEDALSRDKTHVSAKIQLANVLIGDCIFSREEAEPRILICAAGCYALPRLPRGGNSPVLASFLSRQRP